MGNGLVCCYPQTPHFYPIFLLTPIPIKARQNTLFFSSFVSAVHLGFMQEHPKSQDGGHHCVIETAIFIFLTMPAVQATLHENESFGVVRMTEIHTSRSLEHYIEKKSCTEKQGLDKAS